MGHLVGIRLLMNMKQVMQTAKSFYPDSVIPLFSMIHRAAMSYNLSVSIDRGKELKLQSFLFFFPFPLSRVPLQQTAANSFNTKEF